MTSTVQLSDPKPEAYAKDSAIAARRCVQPLGVFVVGLALYISTQWLHSLFPQPRAPAAMCSCRSRSPKPTQKTQQLLRGEQQPVGSGAPLSCMCVLACHSVQGGARVCNNLRFMLPYGVYAQKDDGNFCSAVFLNICRPLSSPSDPVTPP